MVFIEVYLEESSLFILFRTPDLSSDNQAQDQDPDGVDICSNP